MTSAYTRSLVVVCPDAYRDGLLALGLALPNPIDGGMDVPLSADGSEPATHWGAHSWATIEVCDYLTGTTPPPSIPAGVTAAQVAAILTACTVSHTDGETLRNRPHFDSVINSLGLQIVVSAEDE